MIDPQDVLRSADERALPFRARADLQVVRAAYSGHGLYVVRDPVSQEVFQLTPQEHALLQRLKAPATLLSLQQALQRQFAPLRATTQQIQQFLQRLYEQGLLLSQQPGQGASLLERGRRRTLAGRLVGMVQLLSIRIGGVTPGRALDAVAATFGWIFSPLGAVLAGLVAMWAVALAIAGRAQLASELPRLSEIFAARTWPIWIASIVVVKIMHELGHAIACRRFGGRCQEIGVLLLAGLPTLYCDVSDAWRLPNKWHRMAISAAGMYVELIIAALAVVVWRFTHPGVIHAVCMSLVVVCSFGTLVVNANPLLRYDGYYLLSDLLEVPNLAERSRRLWTDRWRRWLLGQPAAVDPWLSASKRTALRIYAVAAKLYLALILVGLFSTALQLARPRHLENAVYTLAAVAAIGLLLQPVASAARLLSSPFTRARIRTGRLALVLVAAAGGAALVLGWPVTRRVAAPMVVAPARSFPLFATVGGTLEFSAAPGAWVNAGEVVARLGDADSKLAILQQTGQLREREMQLAQLLTLRSVDPSLQRLLPAARAEVADAAAQLQELEGAAQALDIRAPAAGTVLAPPGRVSDAHPPETLPRWSGSPLDPCNQGAWIEPGAAIAVLAADEKLLAWAAVDQTDVNLVQCGQPVRVLTLQSPTQILRGRVVRVSRRARANRTAEGNVAVSNERGSAGRYHVVEIALDAAEDSTPLQIGARGMAKIQIDRSTVWELLTSQLRRVIRTRF